MPNCFQLYPKGSNAPAILQDVDAAICQHFGAPVDPVHWFRDWYHCIGFLIAMKGHALGSPELRAEIIAWHEGDPAHYLAAQLAILDYLSAHYTSNAWVEIGRRATV